MDEFLHFNAGNLATIATFIMGGIAFVYAIRVDLNLQSQKMDLLHQQNSQRLQNLENEIKILRDVVVDQAKQKTELFSLTEKLNLFERRFDKVLDHMTHEKNKEN